MSSPIPNDEHIFLLRTLIECAPGKGLVIGKPGPAALRTFRSCALHGWVESIAFESTHVWKITPTGRAVFQLAIVEQMSPVADC